MRRIPKLTMECRQHVKPGKRCRGKLERIESQSYQCTRCAYVYSEIEVEHMTETFDAHLRRLFKPEVWHRGYVESSDA